MKRVLWGALIAFWGLQGCGGGGGRTEPAPTEPNPGGSAPAPVQASVWLTTYDGAQRLQAQEPIRFASEADVPPDANAVAIDIDETKRFQTMVGFGASLTDSSAWLIGTRLSTEQRATLLRNLFDPAAGIGLSFLRLPMGSSEFALTDYTYADGSAANFSIEHDRSYILPVLKEALALNPGLRIMGTPWSAPAWMKTTGMLDGGELRSDAYDDYASYFVRFLQAYAQEAVPIESVTMVNEPLAQGLDYPSMLMPADQQIVFLRDHLGPALRDSGLTTRVFVFDHNWDNADYALQVLGDAGAAQYAAGTAFHCYGGDVSAQLRVQAAFPEKEIRLTECTGSVGSAFGPDMLWWMHNLFIGAVRDGASVVSMWNFALDESSGPHNGGCPNCRGVVTINQSTGDVTYNGEYYALGHASLAARPGAVRVESSVVMDVIDSVAFVNPDGSKGVLLLNERTAPTVIRIHWSGQVLTREIPAQSVVTFRWP